MARHALVTTSPGGLTWEAPAPHAAVPTEAIAICCDAKSLPEWHYTSDGKFHHEDFFLESDRTYAKKDAVTVFSFIDE